MLPHVGRSWLALALAIAAWSLSPLLIVSASHLAPAPVVALYAVSFGSILAAVVLSRTSQFNVRAVLDSTLKNGMFSRAVAVGLGAFFLYPMLYFSAIQSGPPVLVNLVNYLWPVVGLILVAAMRPEARSLELVLAGGFGFAGAALAITAGTGGEGTPGFAGRIVPFILAAGGAVVYGAVSASTNLWRTRTESNPLAFVLMSLFIGGFVSLVLLVILLMFWRMPLATEVSATRIIALAAYATLLPFAHLSWLTAVQDTRIPGFASAFLVPVFATGLLAIFYSGSAGPQLLAAVTLVLSGIVFSTSYERRIPGAFAVILAGLGSIQISQTLPETLTKGVDPSATVFNEPIVGLAGIVGGFILTNAIARYGRLQRLCGEFYGRARELHATSRAKVEKELDLFDDFVLRSGERHALSGTSAQSEFGKELARHWSEVELVLMNRVSRYEWLVLTIGSIGIILALQVSAIVSRSPMTITIRALSTALVVGLLFAVRDYDLNRPDRMSTVLKVLRNRFDFPIVSESPLDHRLRHGIQRIGRLMRFLLIMLVLVTCTSVILNAA